MFPIQQIIHCRTKKPLEIAGTCAIVGNSDQLLNGNFGEEIDSYGNVFRFNLASTEDKYAKQIGKRADYYLMSQNITHYDYPHPEPLQTRFKQICRSSKVICYADFHKNVMKFCKRPYFLVNDIAMINDTICRMFAIPPVQFPPINHPRNGVKLTIALVAAGIKPTLFGFDLIKREECSHYFDDEKQIDVGEGEAGHRLDLEYKLLTALADRDIIQVRD